MIAIVDLNGEYERLTTLLVKLGEEPIVTKNELKILKADKIIIPGSGVAFKAIRDLNLYNIGQLIKISNKPILGISLGMEILCEYSEEGKIYCLGCIPGKVIRINGKGNALTFEHYSKIKITKKCKLLEGVKPEDEFYFRHNYYVPSIEQTCAIISAEENASAVVRAKNFWGVQFFPERSGEAGELVLKNFINNCN